MENLSVILLKQSLFMAMHDIYFVIVNYIICFFLSLRNYSICCACASFTYTYMTGCMLLT